MILQERTKKKSKHLFDPRAWEHSNYFLIDLTAQLILTIAMTKMLLTECRECSECSCSTYQFRITVVTSFQNVLVPCDKKYKSIDVGVLIA